MVGYVKLQVIGFYIKTNHVLSSKFDQLAGVNMFALVTPTVQPTLAKVS